MGLTQAKITELHERRASLIAEARAISDKAAAEKRSLTSEEDSNYRRAFADANEIADQIKREQELRSAERELERMSESRGREIDPEEPVAEKRRQKLPKAPGLSEYRGVAFDAEKEARDAAAFSLWLRAQVARGDHAERRAVIEEARALQADLDIYGGFATMPAQQVASILKGVDDRVFVRQLGTVFPVGGSDGLGVVSLDADPADANWTSELGTGSEDSTTAFGGRELKPNPLAKRIKISRKLLRSSAVPMESFVRDRLAYKFGITLEKAAMTGTGAAQPLGLFTASSSGISTSRDVSTGNTTTELRPDGWIAAKYELKESHRANAVAILHRDAVEICAKWKDGEGRYFLSPSLREGEVDRIQGIPVYESEYAPNTFTTGQYVGVIGDLSYYWWADSLALEMQRLEELYAETNQVGLIGRLETDGMPVLEEAFVRIKLA